MGIKVFGSVARGGESAESDFDLLIEAPPGLSLLGIANLELALEGLLGLKMDLVEAEAISPYFREEVLQKAKPL